MSNYLAGHAAEQRAARYLAQQGYLIRQLNWRTRYCEIDIIARRNSCLYFVEVKYRRAEGWMPAIASVTNHKLARMRLAAELWMATHHWSGDVRMMVVAIDGSTFRLEVLDA